MDGSDLSIKSAGDVLSNQSLQCDLNLDNTRSPPMESVIDGRNLPSARNGDTVDSAPILSYSNDSYKGFSKSWVSVKELESYKMTNNRRGYFIIYSFEKFDPKQKLPDRTGNAKDIINLEAMAANLGFEEIETFKDFNRKEVLSSLTELSRKSYLHCDCFACAILTHGATNGVLYSYDEEMKISDFTKPFESQNCTSLAEKPKLFFIQACRGKNLDSGFKRVVVDAVDSGTFNTSNDFEEEEEVFIPSQADFLIAQSTCPEYYAWRNVTNGSVFIQALCQIFNANYKTKDILQMLTMVNCTVACDWKSDVPHYPEYHQKKQIPSITSQLTKSLRFESKNQIEKDTTEEKYKTTRRVRILHFGTILETDL